MSKALKIFLIIIFIILAVPILAFLSYSPRDHCKDAPFWKEQYQEYSSKMGLTYRQYKKLGSVEAIRRMKEDKKYKDIMAIGAAYEGWKERELLCIELMGVSKYDRFLMDVFSGEYP